ncbi:MAG: hypothetical protein HOJ62_11800 [Planctomycetaceae bacterium]|nr:hypothetical protein [Planctomycetaceae bacterium]
MVFEHIENLKNAYTDKNVIVDADRPELGRFQGLTGTVRTVNMSGRALVEFDGHKNIGWFDIDVDFLKLVDKPTPAETPVASPADKKPAATEKPAAAKPDAAPTDPSKMNVADMLAAARGESATPTATEEPAAEDEKPTAAATNPASMSVAEMLAAARDESAAPAAAEEPAAEEPAAEEPAAEEPAEGGGDEVQALKDANDAAGMCAYCRKVDA